MIYDYRCSSCEAEYEVFQQMKQKPIVKCEKCGQDTAERLISGGIHASVKEVKTLGQLADVNRKKYGSELTEQMLKGQKTQKKPGGDNAKRPMELPEGAQRKQNEGIKIDYDLMNASPKEKEKYIMTGQRPIPKKSNQNF